MRRRGYSLIHVIVIIIITSIVSAFSVGIIFFKSSNDTFGDCSTLQSDKNIKEFLNVYSRIVDGYYEDIDKEKVIENAINGMMNYLNENYTTYLEGEDADNLVQQLNGKYEGIGITIKDHKVLNVVMGSPAENAGVQPGDYIKIVNGVDVEEKTNEEIVDLIKSNGDNVELGVLRDNTFINYTMSIKELRVPSTSYNMIENTDIGLISISVFSDGTAEELKNALNQLKSLGMKKLVLDLRNNTGGYLEEAQKTASLFLEKGKIIYTLKNKESSDKYVDKTTEHETLPIVVLVNKSTASAAEILAGALKDSYNAVLVGQNTFGKGKVQHTYSLDNGDIVKYTSSKWLRPNGVCVDEVGIKPDFEIQNEFVYDESDPENITIIDIIDNQLNKAIELLSI